MFNFSQSWFAKLQGLANQRLSFGNNEAQ